MKVSCLHIFITIARHESRFLRQARTAIRSRIFSEVELAAKWEPGLAECERVDEHIVIRRLRLRTLFLPKSVPFQVLKYIEWGWLVARHSLKLRPGLAVAHSIGALPAGVLVKYVCGARLMYDAHELETERNGLSGMRQRMERVLERVLIRHCDSVACVSESIADWYAGTYRIVRPSVIRNLPDTTNKKGRDESSFLRAKFGVPDTALLFIYQGGLFKGRRIEQFLRVFAKTPDHHVVFMGYGELDSAVQESAAHHANIHYLPAVPPDLVSSVTAGADIGLTGVEHVCLSYYYSLPNKLFEYLSAGLPVIVSDAPEMRQLVERYDCGWVTGDSEEDWSNTIGNINPAAVQARRPGVLLARKDLTWESEEPKLVKAFRQAMA